MKPLPTPQPPSAAANAMTSHLQRLMAAHDAALAAFDAENDNEYDKDDDATGRAVDALRDAILALCERAAWEIQNSLEHDNVAQHVEDLQFALQVAHELLEPTQDALEAREGQNKGGAQ